MIKSNFLDDLEVAHFMRSTKGHAQLVDKSGYIYNKHRTNASGIIFWSCREDKRWGCKARVHTEGFHIIKYCNQHSHEQPAVPYSRREKRISDFQVGCGRAMKPATFRFDVFIGLRKGNT